VALVDEAWQEYVRGVGLAEAQRQLKGYLKALSAEAKSRPEASYLAEEKGALDRQLRQLERIA
jgi:hypothetical protein